MANLDDGLPGLHVRYDDGTEVGFQPYGIWQRTSRARVTFAYTSSDVLAYYAREIERLLFQSDVVSRLGVPAGDLRYRILGETMDGRRPVETIFELPATLYGVVMWLMGQIAPDVAPFTQGMLRPWLALEPIPARAGGAGGRRDSGHPKRP